MLELKSYCRYKFANLSCKNCPAIQNKTENEVLNIECDCINALKIVLQNFTVGKNFVNLRRRKIKIEEDRFFIVESPSKIGYKPDNLNFYTVWSKSDGFMKLSHKA